MVMAAQVNLPWNQTSLNCPKMCDGKMVLNEHGSSCSFSKFSSLLLLLFTFEKPVHLVWVFVVDTSSRTTVHKNATLHAVLVQKFSYGKWRIGHHGQYYWAVTFAALGTWCGEVVEGRKTSSTVEVCGQQHSWCKGSLAQFQEYCQPYTPARLLPSHTKMIKIAQCHPWLLSTVYTSMCPNA